MSEEATVQQETAAEEMVEETVTEEAEPVQEETAADKKKRRASTRKKSGDTMTVKKAEWEKLIAMNEEYLDAAKRIKAEFDNFRKRNETVRSDSYNEGIAQAVLTLLPVVDNLERAQETFADLDEGHRQGMELILRQTMDALAKLGAEVIPAEGEKFDPNIHQAVMQIEGAEGQETGDVAQVLMKGYRIGEKVLRYAMVAVVQ